MKSILCSIAALGILAYAAPASAQDVPVCGAEDKKCPADCPKDPDCPPPPNGEADCSPGFYKNHVEAWCSPLSGATELQCETSPGVVEAFTCQELVCLLSAEGGATLPGGTGCGGFRPTAADRAFAKGCLDALSPADICEEED